MVSVRLALLCLAVNMYAALPAATTWEVRQGGNAANGGGFVTGSSGIDRSQSTTAFCSATDLVLVTTTTATSATCPFSADSVGNLIQITAGANCTAGFYHVQSVATATATLDRVAGTTGCTAGTFALGGALASLATPYANATSGNTIWVKDDGMSYSVSSNISTTVSLLSTFGYGTTRGDGQRPTFLLTTNGIVLVTFNNGSLFSNTFANFNLDCDARTGSGALSGNNGTKSYANIVAIDCAATAIQVQNGQCVGCTVQGQVAGISFVLNGASCFGCYVTTPTSGTSHGFSMQGGNTTCFRCVVVGNASATSADAFQVTAGTVQVMESSCYNAGRDCLRTTCASSCGSLDVYNFVAWLAGGWCVNHAASGQPAIRLGYNAYGGCASGTVTGVAAGGGSVTLTMNPFVSVPSNLTLNEVSGGGASARAAGYPGSSPLGTGYPDMGAYQSQVSAVPVYSGTAQ